MKTRVMSWQMRGKRRLPMRVRGVRKRRKRPRRSTPPRGAVASAPGRFLLCWSPRLHPPCQLWFPLPSSERLCVAQAEAEWPSCLRSHAAAPGRQQGSAGR